MRGEKRISKSIFSGSVTLIGGKAHVLCESKIFFKVLRCGVGVD